MIAVESVLNVSSSVDLVYDFVCVFFCTSCKDADFIKLRKVLQKLFCVGSDMEDIFFGVIVNESLIEIKDKKMGMRGDTRREEGIRWHF